jgi:imidazolonepropionase-like amidohydrolase
MSPTPGDVVTKIEAIVAASLHGAIAMGINGERGVIETGKAADLVVLDGNPLEDIRNTTLIRFVVKDGILIRPN